MSFNLNQFALTNQPGEVMNVNPSTIAVRISKDQVGTLIAGDVLKWHATEVGDLPVMQKAVSGDSGRAVILFNPKKGTYAANDVVEVGISGTIVTMAAATNLNRGINVAYNSVSGQIQSTSGNYIGWTLDIASVTGDIVRVHVSPLLSAV